VKLRQMMYGTKHFRTKTFFRKNEGKDPTHVFFSENFFQKNALFS
jgi:hypothetical protein